MIQIWDYNMSQVQAVINPISCTVTSNLSTYPTCKIECYSSEIIDQQKYLELKQKMWIDTGYCKDWFIIKNITVEYSKTTIEGEHMLSQAESAFCCYWRGYYSSTTEIENGMTVFNEILCLNRASYGYSSTYAEFSNNYYSYTTTANTIKYQAFYIDTNGNYTLIKDTPISPDVNVDPGWDLYVQPDCFGKSMQDIAKTLADECGANLFYVYDMIIVTFQPLAKLMEYLVNDGTYVYYCDLRSIENYQTSGSALYTSTNASKFSVKGTDSNFIGAILPSYTYEKNNRLKKETTSDVLREDGEPYWVYNYEYYISHTEQDCLKYAKTQKYSPDREWNRNFKFGAVLYNWIAGYLSSYPYQLNYTKEYDNSYAVSSEHPISIKMQNIVGEEITTISIAAASSSKVTIYKDGTAIGWYTCVLVSGETTKYTVVVSCVMNLLGAVTPESGESIQSYTITTSVDTPKNDFKLVNVFGEEIGKMDWENWQESDSGTTCYPLYEEVSTESSDTTTKSLRRCGNVWVTMVEAYTTYFNAYYNTVYNLAATEANSYNAEQTLNSVSTDIIPQTLKGMILPGDEVNIWIERFDRQIEFECSSVTYDSLNEYYTDISIGYKKPTLKVIGKALNKVVGQAFRW